MSLPSSMSAPWASMAVRCCCSSADRFAASSSRSAPHHAIAPMAAERYQTIGAGGNVICVAFARRAHRSCRSGGTSCSQGTPPYLKGWSGGPEPAAAGRTAGRQDRGGSEAMQRVVPEYARTSRTGPTGQGLTVGFIFAFDKKKQIVLFGPGIN